MKHVFTTCALILLTACASAPTPPLPTATPSLTTILTNTPTSTRAPTTIPTNTATATRTLTPTPTATSTMTPTPLPNYQVPISVSNITLRGLGTVRDSGGADYNVRQIRVDLKDGRVMFLGTNSRVISVQIGSGCPASSLGNVLIYNYNTGESLAQKPPDFWFDYGPNGYPTFNPKDSGCEKLDGSYTGNKPSESDIALALSVYDYIAHTFSRGVLFTVDGVTPTRVPSR